MHLFVSSLLLKPPCLRQLEAQLTRHRLPAGTRLVEIGRVYRHLYFLEASLLRFFI